MKKISLYFISVFSLMLTSCKPAPPGEWNYGFFTGNICSSCVYNIALASDKLVFDLNKEDLVLDLYLGLRIDYFDDNAIDFALSHIVFTGVYVQDLPDLLGDEKLDYTTDYKNGDYSHFSVFGLLKEIDIKTLTDSFKNDESYFSDGLVNFTYKDKLVIKKDTVSKLLEYGPVNYLNFAFRIVKYVDVSDDISYYWHEFINVDIEISNDLIVTLN